jgi:hypothetical protein
MSATMSIKYINALEYVRKAKEIRDPEALAEYQVEQIESAVELRVQQAVAEVNKVRVEFNSKDLATKSDLSLVKSDLNLFKSELKSEMNLLRSELHNDMLRFFIRGGIAFGSGMLALASIMARGFHWI